MSRQPWLLEANHPSTVITRLVRVIQSGKLSDCGPWMPRTSRGMTVERAALGRKAEDLMVRLSNHEGRVHHPSSNSPQRTRIRDIHVISQRVDKFGPFSGHQAEKLP